MRLLVLLLIATPCLADDRVEFFEAKVRPVLVEHCYSCHSATAKKIKGGLRLDGREAMLAGGDSGPAITSGDPEKSRLIDAVRFGNADLQMPPKGKLPAAAIKDLEAWVKAGAVWPAEKANAAAKEVFNLQKRKAEHWCWQPVTRPAVPKVQGTVRDPIDAFILAKLEENGITPAPPASKSVWLRRVTFALTGLPPTPADLAAFEADDKDSAFETVVDRLLASPAYGERWGRHWLDLVRYAESRGHENDHDIPNAWIYRDYVVNAFNEDISYRDFVSEQICGHSVKGRRYREGFRNESVIGTAFWRLGEEVHSPVDIRQDQADRLDNRIDVFSKAILGLTVSCARCHDHKFDAISTKDYYAVMGLLEASSDTPVRVQGTTINVMIRAARNVRLSQLTNRAVSTNDQAESFANWKKKISVIRDYSQLPPLRSMNFGSFDDALTVHYPGEGSLHNLNGKSSIRLEARGALVLDRFWDKLTATKGTEHEPGKLHDVRRAGFTVRSPLFKLEKDNVYLLVRGGGVSYAAVGGHTMINGPLHGKLVEPFKDAAEYRWVRHSLKDYKGLIFRVEVSADAKTEFAISMIVQADESPTLPPTPPVQPLSEEHQRDILMKIGTTDEPVWESQLVPGVVDGASIGEQVFIRGNPRSLGEHVMPRMPEAFEYAQEYPLDSHVILHSFADRVVDKRNPLLSRVAVNRFWHHLFGRGIVASVDNFGVLGERPTHPELLDYLASEFAAGEFKMKPFLKRLVLTQTYRMSSSPADDPRDPTNALLHHFRVKRLEGEAIRDSLLLVSGRLDRAIGGPSVATHLTAFMDGRGKPGKSGPLDGDGRRSIYLAVRRNFLNPFLQAFDTPIPFTTVGARSNSNVPAQALILMNDPFVRQQAELWGRAVSKLPGDVNDRISTMYRQGFARPPTHEEVKLCREFLDEEPDVAAWERLAHSLIQVKEFRFVP